MIKNLDFLSPRFLQYFSTVVETGSILAASEEINVSQPSITRVIQIIEKNLNTKLFVRNKKGVKLTEDGQEFYLNAKTILSHSEKAISSIQSNKVSIQNENIEFKIGLANTLSQTHKERILWVLKRNNSDKRFKISEEESFTLNEKVLENEIDYAFTCIPISKKNINKINLYNDNFCVAFYKGHEFQNLKTVDIEKVRSDKNYVFRNTCEFFYYEHIKRTNKAPSYDEIRDIISNRKKVGRDRDVIYTNSDTTAASCIKAGIGIAVIPESVAIDQKLLYRPISKPTLSREICLIRNIKNKRELDAKKSTLRNAIWL
ncbi:LysR family transcriptional regulator [Candidatus Pelagibacter sp.]|uniref:LysR family transcriptional regulator n=1 Tax=Candidatus Pelagibacter sp. TaxID=2024849 RepID=UPI003F852E57